MNRAIFVECNADYWYERYLESKVSIYRPIDQLLASLVDDCPYAKKVKTLHSIILTVHNKEFLLDRVLNGIQKNTTGEYELIIVLDGCTDKSSEIVEKFINKTIKSISKK